MGPILNGHHTYQLQLGSRECILCPFAGPTMLTPVKVNFFVGMSGVAQLYRIWEYVHYYLV
jgi:hypothetical protein